jgi:acetylornithine deacetylase/succinyl-diaminopimelate desuccinylase-like protein
VSGASRFTATAADHFPKGLPSASVDAALMKRIGAEAGDDLVQLIRAESVNPPGNETRAAKVLIELLRREGLEPEFFEPIPDRGNVSVRLRGSASAANPNLDPRDPKDGALLLFAHLDVVPANQDGWTVNPFEGVIKEGYIWGRGAVDMKGALAVQIGVFRLLCERARAAGLNPAKDVIPGLRRDIILTATADEETGGLDGIALVLKDRKHWLDAAVGLTEAGGMTITAAGRRIYPLQVAEKGFARFAITVSGRWGHASMPDSDNALLRAAQVVERVSVPGPVQIVPENEALLAALRAALPAGALGRLERLLGEQTFDDAKDLNREAAAAGCAPELLRALRAVLRDTFAPTILTSGIRSNVLPGSATLTVDSRILPGTTREAAERNMLDRIGADLAPFVKLDLIEYGAAVSNPMDHEILGIASAAIRTRDSEAILMPAVAPYATDAKITVPAGIPTYGFSPYLLDPKERFMERFHGIDERVSQEALAWGVEVLYDVTMGYAGE